MGMSSTLANEKSIYFNQNWTRVMGEDLSYHSPQTFETGIMDKCLGVTTVKVY